MKVESDYNKYGIVIDSGSSGSRIQIYQWKDQKYVKESSQDDKVLKSPPKIIQEEGWSFKITPGISTYNDPQKAKALWPEHFEKLMDLANKVIPLEKHKETPVFVLATAGMRLQSPSKQKLILDEICSSLQSHTSFYIPNCKDFVQVIDGSTEGVYGWLGLNYLLGQFDNYDNTESIHESIGFMDMGGASTQIAFVPSSIEEIERNREDLSSVTLRNINGQTQEWKLFVETWLGFGANEARKRYLSQLINISQVNPSIGSTINDPCMPLNSELDFEYNEQTYKFKGIGNYEMCLKTIYPLLLKNVPCIDDPCLFNGVHGPKLDFAKDKFIGISEYWYTANDIFQSGGEYNFIGFSKKVQQYCESDWSQILRNSQDGQYSNLDPDKFLKDACFKASWVINILHDGFELPRLGLEIPELKGEENEEEIKKLENIHVPFKSANSVNGEELSWTLGKILQFASSQIDPPNDEEHNLEIGIYPSEISNKQFVPAGYLELEVSSNEGERFSFSGSKLYSIFFIFFIFYLVYHFAFRSLNKHAYRFRRITVSPSLKNGILRTLSKIPYVRQVLGESINYQNYLQHEDINMTLEEGLMPISSKNNDSRSSVLRTRSAISLFESQSPETHHEEDFQRIKYQNFFNKPFLTQNKSVPNLNVSDKGTDYPGKYNKTSPFSRND